MYFFQNCPLLILKKNNSCFMNEKNEVCVSNESRRHPEPSVLLSSYYPLAIPLLSSYYPLTRINLESLTRSFNSQLFLIVNKIFNFQKETIIRNSPPFSFQTHRNMCGLSEYACPCRTFAVDSRSNVFPKQTG